MLKQQRIITVYHAVTSNNAIQLFFRQGVSRFPFQGEMQAFNCAAWFLERRAKSFLEVAFSENPIETRA
jgi:hypothetical protein